MTAEFYANELGAQLQELRLKEQRVLELQKGLHAAPGVGDKPAGVAAHRFTGKFWPKCAEMKCAFDVDLEADWRGLLEICLEINGTIEAAEAQYLGAVERINSGTENKERQVERQKRIVGAHFDDARAKGPKYLMNPSKLREELACLDAQRTGKRP